MTEIVVTVDNALRLDDKQLSDGMLQMLWQAVNVINPDDEEERILLASRGADGRLVLPRGFAHRLRTGLASGGYTIRWDDHRVSMPAENEGVILHEGFEPRAYQERALAEMITAEQGILVAPPGAGKSAMTAMMIGELQERTIIIVDKINLMKQWAARIEDVLGETPAIFDAKMATGPITLATRQGLWSRREKLDKDGWWNQWGCVVVDECHAMSGETARAVVERFPARHRYGLSATPDRHSWLRIVGRSIIGEVFCEITEQELEEAGVLIRPRVIAMKTEFAFPWKKDAHHQRQWQALVGKLKFDRDRNKVIGAVFAGQRGHSMLVSTDHLDHADELVAIAYASGWPMDRVLLLTGKQDAEERERVLRLAEEGDCIIVSTIGKEALDIPRLDRYLVPWPQKGGAMLIQMIGRLRRTHADKNEPPILFDVWDPNVSVLMKHFHTRRVIYAQEGLDLQVVNTDGSVVGV